MLKAITRLFDNQDQALAAVAELEAAGVHHSRLSLITRDRRRVRIEHGDTHSETAVGAVQGAATLGLAGGGAGLVACLGMLAVPGLGPVVAAGWLVSTAAGAVMGVVAGAVAGGFLGALEDAGHTGEEVDVYAEGVKCGAVLLSIMPDTDSEAELAQEIVDRHGGFGATHSGAQSAWPGLAPSDGPAELHRQPGV